jgi:3-oxoacyl-[acyl-carrier protein] reductase
MLNREDEDNFYDTHQPVERIGLPEEVAELAIFLMSDAANYIVGQTIVCDGGYTLNA